MSCHILPGCKGKYQVIVAPCQCALLSTMIIFIAVFVLLMNILQVSGVEDDDVLYFEDIQSDQLREDWDSLPLISQIKTKTKWCEVTPAGGPQLCHH